MQESRVCLLILALGTKRQRHQFRIPHDQRHRHTSPELRPGNDVEGLREGPGASSLKVRWTTSDILSYSSTIHCTNGMLCGSRMARYVRLKLITIFTHVAPRSSLSLRKRYIMRLCISTTYCFKCSEWGSRSMIESRVTRMTYRERIKGALAFNRDPRHSPAQVHRV